MNRPMTILGVTAVSLALLTGCGKDKKSGSPCRDAYVKKIDTAISKLEKAPPNTDYDTAIGDAMEGKPKECEDLAGGLVEAIIEQVLDENSDRLAKLQDKFPEPSASPEASETGSPSPEESASPSPSADSSDEESPSPSPSSR